MKNNKNLFQNCFIVLCVSMVIMLSGHALAAPGGNGGGGGGNTTDMATQAELDAEIAARQNADTNLQSADTAEATARQSADATELAARQAADAALQLNLNNALSAQITIDDGQNATIQVLQSALIQAQADVADLRALINTLHPPKQIGDYFGGGIVFYVDETGRHGLIAALADLTDGENNHFSWYNGVFKFTGATGNGIGAGVSNTAIIVAAQAADVGDGRYAARLAADFAVQDDGVSPCTITSAQCHGDWYLPSYFELNLLYNAFFSNQERFSGLANNAYWSSTDYSEERAFEWYFNPTNYGTTGAYTDIKSGMSKVRPIRRF